MCEFCYWFGHRGRCLLANECDGDDCDDFIRQPDPIRQPQEEESESKGCASCFWRGRKGRCLLVNEGNGDDCEDFIPLSDFVRPRRRMDLYDQAVRLGHPELPEQFVSAGVTRLGLALFVS